MVGYFDRRASEENLKVSLKQRERREKKEKKMIQRQRKEGVSPISIKVSLSNARDLHGKENRPATDELHTPVIICIDWDLLCRKLCRTVGS